MCQQASCILQKVLCSRSWLQIPNFDGPLLQLADASNMGIEVVLTQMHNQDQEHLVAYLSCKHHSAEEKYSTIEEREAIRWAVKRTHYKLANNPFLLVDPASLQWLASVKDHNPRILWWYLSLLPFRFTLLHHCRQLHHNVIFLFRRQEESYPQLRSGGVVGSPRGKLNPTTNREKTHSYLMSNECFQLAWALPQITPPARHISRHI